MVYLCRVGGKKVQKYKYEHNMTDPLLLISNYHVCMTKYNNVL